MPVFCRMQQVQAGTALTFNISGTADDIVFFSGELGKTYALKDVTQEPTSGNPEFEFLSNLQFGTVGLNNLSVLISNDFTGKYDTTSIKAATWTNITSRAILGTSATNVTSGVINLNDLKADGKPLYVAFRYLSDRASTLKQRQWTISNFQFRTKFADGKVYTGAASNADAGFGPIEFKGDSARWVAGTSLAHVGLALGYPSDDDWAISKPFDLSTIVPDRKGSINIKAAYQAAITSYNFTYNTPGTYTATFVATNQNIDAQRQTVKQIVITVTP
jgi:hypothetical protein